MTRKEDVLIYYILSVSLILLACKNDQKTYTTWEVYGGGKEAIRYSSLTEMDTSNVYQLQVAWTYRTGDADTVHSSQIQCNPIVVDGILYGTSPQMKLFALDAATGQEKWVFNPFDTTDKKEPLNFVLNNSRGVAYWSDGKEDKRLYYTAGSHLYCIAAATGKPVSEFGTNGKIDLHDGLGRDVKDLFVTATTPGIIFKDLIIMGIRVDEGPNAAPGHIRAYDVRTGRQHWIFHTIPYPGEYGYNTWEDTAAYKYIGGVNAWSGFSLDEERGMVFAGTGSASYDFYGGKRRGDNLFANCILALDAATGRRIWHFQTIHHDTWDHDLPTPPALVTITKDGKRIDAVAQSSKLGFVYLFERTTGKPIFPINEQPAPAETELTGEKLASTQPIPSLPEPFVRQQLTENDLNHLLSDTSLADVKKRFQSYKKGHMFMPLSKQGTIVFPGLDGGGEWGGPAYDPQTGLLYVNANEMAWVLTIVDKKKREGNETYLSAGKRLYESNCMTCHGGDRRGSGNNPSLLDVHKRYKPEQFYQLVSSGRRMMPAFKQLNTEEREAIASYILNVTTRQKEKFTAVSRAEEAYTSVPYTITGYNKFLSKEGHPAIKPPWGTLNAINLSTGKIVWKTVLGNDTAFASKGVQTGTENYGGPVVTAGGVVFIAATKDNKLRAFHKGTGKLLWEADLPASGFATPSVYSLNGKQYVVIACGGGKLKTKSGDAYVAFSLPNKK